MALELPVDEIARYYLVRVLEETHALAVGAVDFCLAQVDYLSVLVEFWVVECGVHSQHYR